MKIAVQENCAPGKLGCIRLHTVYVYLKNYNLIYDIRLPQCLVVPHQEVPHVAPHCTVVVDVRHGVLQRRLQCLLVVLEQVEHRAPHQRGEPGEHAEAGGRNYASLRGQASESNSDAGEEVEIDLREKVIGGEGGGER